MEQKKRIGIWIRVSTEFQVKDDSPETHELRAKYFAEAKGWEIVEVYRLDAVSGKTVMDHPITKKMLSDIQRGHITGLIFSKLARLARNAKELLEFSDYFREHNADLISLAENIDTGSPSGRMFFTIIAALAEWERAEIAQRVAASVPVRAKMGKPLGGAASYGYAWKGHDLVVVETEAPVRKLMYELFVDYRRKGHVAKKLNEMGYRTRNGSQFSDTTIGRLLRDTTAKGVRIANYTKSLGEGKKWVVKPESEWVLTPCPAIVSVELWDDCNRILDEQERKNKRPVKVAKHLFTGIAFCGCGGKMLVPSDGKKYICTKCKKTKIEIGDLEEIYYSQLQGFLQSENQLERLLANASDGIGEKEQQLQQLMADKQRVEREMENIVNLHHAGQIPLSGFSKFYEPLDTQLKQIENAIPHLEAELDFLRQEYLNGDAVVQEARDLFSQWPELDQPAKRREVERITSRITIEGDEIEIRFAYDPSSFGNSPESQRNHARVASSTIPRKNAPARP